MISLINKNEVLSTELWRPASTLFCKYLHIIMFGLLLCLAKFNKHLTLIGRLI